MGIRLDGIYLSSVGFEKYDKTLYRYYLRFYESGEICKGFTMVEPVAKTLFEMDKYVGSGTYQTVGNQVTCTIKSMSHNITSIWHGAIKDDVIDFYIDNPEFEDLDGEYIFVQAGAS